MPSSYYQSIKKRLKQCEDNMQTKEDEISKMKDEIRELKEQNLRFSADVENMRKRTEDEINLNRKYASQDIIIKMLPVLDSLENSNEESNKIILRQIMEILAKEGLKEINDVGTKFDPSKHEAIGAEDGGQENTIKKVIRKGYFFNDKLIRPEMVIINKG